MTTTGSERRLVIMGSKRSGKSAIHSVVFRSMAPTDTLYNASVSPSTSAAHSTLSKNAFLDFSVSDTHGSPDFYSESVDPFQLFSNVICLVFVIDAQDEFTAALKTLLVTVSLAYKVNKDMLFEVFIHKVDGLSDDHKIETQRDIHTRIRDDLLDAGLQDVHIGFHLTSIYDHSVFEAFSKVVQRVLGDEGVLPTLENLLNILCSNSGIEKAFLFDTSTKIYIATDSSPVDVQSYELCADMMDVVNDVGAVYGANPTAAETAKGPQQQQPTDGAGEVQSVIRLNNGMVLYMRGVNITLSLVCLLREENFEKHGLIDFNFSVFREAVNEVFQIRTGSAGRTVGV
ncbi:ras-related GTP-binding protein [Chytriomyces sp. MP71]|nr:ras-related GTP-binding protein [Chytriomyces sp. MP71]